MIGVLNMAKREKRQGKLFKAYVVYCAECQDEAIFEPVIEGKKEYLYHQTAELWLVMQGWMKIKGLWYCLKCYELHL